METTLGKYIKEKRLQKRLTQGQLSVFSGLDRGYISLLESEKRKITPKPDTLVKLAKGLKINPRILYEKAGIIPDDNDLEEAGLFDYNTPSDSVAILGSIWASAPDGVEQDIKGKQALPDSLVRKYGLSNLMALQVNGDSMNKVIPDGAIAVLNKNINPIDIENGEIYAVIVNGYAGTLKRVYRYDHEIKLVPDSFNSIHKTTSYKDDDDIEVIVVGKLVWYGVEF